MLTIITDEGLNRIDPSKVTQVKVFMGKIQIQESMVLIKMNYQTGVSSPVNDFHYTNLEPLPNQEKVLKKIIRLVEKKKKGTYRFTTKKVATNQQKAEKVLKRMKKKVQKKEAQRNA